MGLLQHIADKNRQEREEFRQVILSLNDPGHVAEMVQNLAIDWARDAACPSMRAGSLHVVIDVNGEPSLLPAYLAMDVSTRSNLLVRLAEARVYGMRGMGAVDDRLELLPELQDFPLYLERGEGGFYLRSVGTSDASLSSSLTYEEWLMEEVKDQQVVIGYLNAALRRCDHLILWRAMLDICEAKHPGAEVDSVSITLPVLMADDHIFIFLRLLSALGLEMQVSAGGTQI